MPRLGLHYYPDTLHYRLKDLQTWLPEWQALRISWLTLLGAPTHAIPESFISGLLAARIEPIIHIPLPLTARDSLSTLAPIIKAYADWGVKYVALFDRPNLRAAWPATAWLAGDLVERFLDLYLPLASLLMSSGITPVFPPLEPGGDYWDTAFLSTALGSLVRRDQAELLERLVLGAYGWFYDRPLNWGVGGPERWPSFQPYSNSQASEDHRGFRIFDWYQAIAEALTGMRKQVILLKAGYPDRQIMQPGQAPQDQVALMKLFLTLREGKAVKRVKLPKYAFDLDERLLACNFWLLASQAGHPAARAAWYDDSGRPSPFIRGLKKALNTAAQAHEPSTAKLIHEAHDTWPKPPLFTHYILLVPGNRDFNEKCLKSLEPILSIPSVVAGFSLLEAALAKHVICCDGDECFEPGQIEQLRRAGCQIHKPDPNGINLAQYLTSLDSSIHPHA